MLAFLNGLQHEGPGRFIATHQLNHDGNFGIIDNITRVGGQDLFGDFNAAGCADIHIGNLL